MDRLEILEQLKTMETVDDLAVLLNSIKRDEFPSVRYGISSAMLKYFSSDKIAPKRYRIFHIRKKSGGLREIKAPCRQLDVILTCINVMLKACYEPSDAAMGFTSGKSVLDNASVHVGHNYVFNIDLKDFFPSIPQARVWRRLQLRPFNFSREIANVLAGVCCACDENAQGNVLPQGSPASPLLTNAICDKLDRQMKGVAKRFGLHYSRYADDMTFSSMHNVYQEDSTFRTEIRRIIAEQGFRMNEKKTRLQKTGARQEVTGLTVNAIANVSRKYISDLRWLLHIWEKEGYAKAYALFYPKYKHEKGYIKKGEPVMENVVGGKLNYLRMIRGENNPAYQKLQARYNALQQLVFVDNETDKSKSYVYVQPYSMADFQELFGTKVTLAVTREGKLVGKCEINGMDKTLAISKSTQKSLCPNLENLCKGDCFSSDELSKCFVTLCRNKGKNFWLITKFEPKRSHCLSIQNLKVSPDDMLALWEREGLQGAVDELTLFMQLADPTDSVLDWDKTKKGEAPENRGTFNFTKENMIAFFLKNKNVTTAHRKKAMQLMMANFSSNAVADDANVAKLLDIWESQGLDAAVKAWKKSKNKPKQKKLGKKKEEEVHTAVQTKNEISMDDIYIPTDSDIEDAETIFEL
jgi:RNA-directed DNA polymerase